MTRRGRLLLLMVPLMASACVRWGIPERDDYGYDYDDDFGESTTDDFTTTSTTTTEPADSSGGEDTTGNSSGPSRTPRPWPEPWPLGADSRLVVWGQSGIPKANLEMFANIFHHLAGVAPGEQALTIGWIGDCDPRTDPDGCSAGDVTPFFEMVDGLGTLEFTSSEFDTSAYDVVVADFCGPVDAERLAVLLADGEGVLALGDRSCTVADGSSSALVANQTLAHFGVRFGFREFDGEEHPVPPEEQFGLLDGVSTLETLDLMLQQTIEPVVVVLETPDGVLLSERSGP